ncbi:MAG: arsenate reductase (glutaredoxin) [Acidiferrobacteraceae bacterium]|jgi:arsenate reductase|nr:arsenate reductase (glutaredoxin) [Acidiferrobacteraceae bacterium]|tara:strand:+ start:438 stop:779 length:342 start_codon:yes stop_codon:yes gene_type:complete
MPILLYHNPRCSKSRATLALLREQGLEPEIVEYLAHPPDEETLKALQASLGCQIRDMMRTGEAPYREMNLAQADEPQLLHALTEHPILLQRPIVVNGKRAAIGRPPENVLEIL